MPFTVDCRPFGLGADVATMCSTDKRAAENVSRPPFLRLIFQRSLCRLLRLPTLLGMFGRSAQETIRQIVRGTGDIDPQQHVS